MTSTDLNGESILILTKQDAEWLVKFINNHWRVETDSIELRRVLRKARGVTDADKQDREGRDNQAG